jgi:hypothetical protein
MTDCSDRARAGSDISTLHATRHFHFGLTARGFLTAFASASPCGPYGTGMTQMPARGPESPVYAYTIWSLEGVR